MNNFAGINIMQLDIQQIVLASKRQVRKIEIEEDGTKTNKIKGMSLSEKKLLVLKYLV